MTATLKILRDEHAALASVLRSMPPLVAVTRGGGAPDFALLRDMVFYVADFPERQHHRKESELLGGIERLSQCCRRPSGPGLDQLHGRSQSQHRGERRCLDGDPRGPFGARPQSEGRDA